jgi:integrase
MLLAAYRHGFRASKVCDLEWSAIDFTMAEMDVSRRKAGKPSPHPIRGDELRELRKLHKQSTGPFVFMSERGESLFAPATGRMLRRQMHSAFLR